MARPTKKGMIESPPADMVNTTRKHNPRAGIFSGLFSGAKAAGSVSGTKRNTGVGYAGSKGSENQNPKISGGPSKMGAGLKPKAKPATGVTSGSITKPSPSFTKGRDELGAFYLNATSGMDIHSRGKKKK